MYSVDPTYFCTLERKSAAAREMARAFALPPPKLIYQKEITLEKSFGETYTA